ncbi:MAG: 16S rRNA (cytosine1402-N4)-methyltransferase [Comamonadaceae bacterium]|nr:MAG: 16S rRNA (cytosine1402-N4)-methyltransferase [Comamonadaceae bacterium]
MAKNGLLAPLQRRLLRADRLGAPFQPHPATRTFQAFRIFINAELEELQQALDASLKVLQPGGRLVVISFHSLEDRIVKQFITKHAKEVFDRRAPFAAPHVMQFNALARVKPSATEVAANPRARSAIMRVAERTAAAAPELRG